MTTVRGGYWKCPSLMGFIIREGFPFKEGFPSRAVGLRCELITRDGERHQAQVDYSTQYRAEGLQWLTSRGKTIDKYVVAAWKEL